MLTIAWIPGGDLLTAHEGGGTPGPVRDAGLAEKVDRLPPLPEAGPVPPETDWLVDPVIRKAGVFRTASAAPEIALDNGLVRRVWRLTPGCATVAYHNLMTGASILRGVKPEAEVTLDGKPYAVGGLTGQVEYAYLRPEWVDGLAADPGAFRLTDFIVGKTKARFPWKRVRYSEGRPWPPPGAALTFVYAPPQGAHPGLTLMVHYELYDGIPCFMKWIELVNGTGGAVRMNTFVSEILAAVEHESAVETPHHWTPPDLHVESDYAFHGMSPGSAMKTVYWEPDPQYSSQVNYRRLNPVLLKCRPPFGPDQVIPEGGSFESFRTFVLAHDGSDRERKGLAVRRMYRTVAPWVTENPILMHVRSAKPEAVKLAVDQCADVGFEMVIMTFGSGFNAENADPAYLDSLKELADYAHGKGIELGGYSLLASRRISDEMDAINPETGKPGGPSSAIRPAS